MVFMLMGMACLFPFFLSAQSVYHNSDFETGTFSGWSAFTGSCCPIETPVVGFDSSRHAIMSGNAIDPYSMGLIPVVAPGGLYSVRLGNDHTGSQAEKLSYTFTVQPQSPFYVYRYAVVFEFPPDHPEIKQPHFEITVRDEDGIPVECGYYQVACANNLPGFMANGDYRFRPWTDVGINLTAYIGRQITIEFATGDCGMGGHFGYAYIDGHATAMKMETSECNDDGTITFTAPPGFHYEWSTGDTTQAINLSSYNYGSNVSLTLKAANGCDYHFSISVPDIVPNAAFNHILKCNNTVEFINTSTDNHGTITSYQWNFGNGTTSSDENPLHSFGQINTYPVSLTVQSSTGCRSTLTKAIAVNPVIETDFIFLNDCSSRTVFFKDQSTALNGSIVSWQWHLGNSTSVLQNPLQHYDENGIFPVTLTVTSDEPCTGSVSKEVMVQCEASGIVFMPSAFTPDNDGRNEWFIPVLSFSSDFTLQIYNRWGKQIYNGKNAGWNGRNENGMLCPQGVYLYQLEWQDLHSGRKVKTGHFTLLK